MTMTRIEIEQYGRTWHAEVEGGTGMTSRRQRAQAGDFPATIAAVVEAWADVNDREPLAILREVGRVMVQRENELMAKRSIGPSEAFLKRLEPRPPVTYDDLGNEQPPPWARRYPPPPPLPKVAEQMMDEALQPTREALGIRRETQPTSGLGSPGFEPVPPRRAHIPGNRMGDADVRVEGTVAEHVEIAQTVQPRRGPGRPRREPAES